MTLYTNWCTIRYSKGQHHNKNNMEVKQMINLRHSETVDTIIDKLSEMQTEFKKIMASGTEKEQDQYLEKALQEVEKLNGRNATYRMWYMAFCDMRDGF